MPSFISSKSMPFAHDLYRTGFGQHADYLFGWEGDSLQRAVDTCTNGNGLPADCKALTVQGMDAMNKCKQFAKIPEMVEGTCKYTCIRNLERESSLPFCFQTWTVCPVATPSRMDRAPPL